MSDSKYPPHPEPIRVEIETTNICNARCEFCPRFNMNRKIGYMDLGNYRIFLKKLEKYRENMWLNKHSENPNRFPRLVFCGFGEPILHPKIIDIVKEGNSHNFETELVTNGSMLSSQLAKKLANAGLTNLSISLHSLDPKIYHEIMGLKLEGILPRIKETLRVLENTNVNIEIWRVSRADGSLLKMKNQDEKNYRDFLSTYSKDIKILGPTVAWNRGGQLKYRFWNKVHDTQRIWCEKLYFTLNITWNGTVLMCCCDYSQATVSLGNAWKDSIEILQKRREEKFKNLSREKICNLCRRPKDTTYRDLIMPTLINF